MKVIQATLCAPILIPGYVRSDTTISTTKHPKIEMSVHDVGILIKAGGGAYLIPYSNVKLMAVEAGDGK